MTKFDVTVQRVEYKEHTFTVECDYEWEAKDLGEIAAHDYDFTNKPCYHSTYEVMHTTEQKEKE